MIELEFVLIIFLLVFYLNSKREKTVSVVTELYESKAFISKETSDILKALCCIIIVLHHFALRCENGWLVTRFFAIGGGSFSLPIFFILSSYGIIKSELKNGTNLISFIKKRFLKILVPFWIVNFVTVLVYGLISPKNLLLEELADHRINPNFVLVGSASIIEKLKMCIGLIEIDGAMWFVYFILISYFVFFISKSLFPLKRMPKSFFILYIVLFLVFFHIFKVPLFYYRYLWSVLLGCFIAVFNLRQTKKLYSRFSCHEPLSFHLYDLYS